MDLKGILSISGHSGLFKLITQARNGIIVESLETKKRMPAYATSKISALEDIAVFCELEDIPLVDVFEKIYEHENQGLSIDHKSKPDVLKAYFAKVLPEYDRDRVYVSDMKRVISWYNILHNQEMLDFSEEESEEKQDAPESKEETKVENGETVTESNTEQEESNK